MPPSQPERPRNAFNLLQAGASEDAAGECVVGARPEQAPDTRRTGAGSPQLRRMTGLCRPFINRCINHEDSMIL